MNKIAQRFLWLICILSFMLAMYFAIIIGEPNTSQTIIWLSLFLFTFIIVNPASIESINFLGNSIKFKQIEEKLDSITHDITLYYQKLQENTKDNEFPVLSNYNASIEELETFVKDIINSSEELVSNISNRLENIWSEIEKFLSEHNVDYSKVKNLEYYKNPFISSNWEEINIGVPNHFLRIKALIAQIFVKHYDILVSNNISLDTKQKKHFDVMKKELELFTEVTLFD